MRPADMVHCVSDREGRVREKEREKRQGGRGERKKEDIMIITSKIE